MYKIVKIIIILIIYSYLKNFYFFFKQTHLFIVEYFNVLKKIYLKRNKIQLNLKFQNKNVMKCYYHLKINHKLQTLNIEINKQ